jgi:hypothetical protein
MSVRRPAPATSEDRILAALEMSLLPDSICLGDPLCERRVDFLTARDPKVMDVIAP